MKHKKTKIILFTSIVLMGVIFLVGGMYVNDYYRASEEAIDCITEEEETVSVLTLDEDTILFTAQAPKARLIFYPGGKVQVEAYAPLMKACAERGILCVLMKMPMNLAVLDMNAADGIKEKVAEHIEANMMTGIDKWYVGGHSLGGSMAAAYMEKNTQECDGLILLASYSTADLSQSGKSVISIYGTEDKVLNMEKYEQYKGNLPEGFYEEVIEGGCHAYFGCYGAQDGDGVPTISNKEQIQITADVLQLWMGL